MSKNPIPTPNEGWGSNHLERRSGSSRGVSFLGSNGKSGRQDRFGGVQESCKGDDDLGNL